MHAVTRVDDWDIEVPRHQVGGAGGRMPKHNGISADCPQGVAGIEQGLAFFDARTGRLHQRSHCAQGFRGELERRTRARRGLVKQKHDALAAQQRPSLHRIHAAGECEQAQDILRVEMFDPEQRTARELIHCVRM